MALSYVYLQFIADSNSATRNQVQPVSCCFVCIGISYMRRMVNLVRLFCLALLFSFFQLDFGSRIETINVTAELREMMAIVTINILPSGLSLKISGNFVFNHMPPCVPNKVKQMTKARDVHPRMDIFKF